MSENLSDDDKMMLEGLYWWDIPTLFRCPIERDPAKLDIALVGVPHSTGNGTTERDQHLGPRAVRDVSAMSRRVHSEFQVDPWQSCRIGDMGDVPLPEANDNERCIERITDFYRALDATGTRPVSIGGDHAITYPLVKAYARKYKKLTILQLDAHPDLYDHYEGNCFAHACPFARIMEENLAGRLIQIGIRTLNPHQKEQAQRFGVEIIEMRHFALDLLPRIDTPVYLSIDLDALDPAYAPGVSHHEPGGMSTRQVIEIIHRLQTPLVGADIVEYNPKRDPEEITAMVAVKLLKEIAARMIEQAGG